MPEKIQEIKLDDIEVSELNTRKNLNAGTEDSSLDDLAESIEKEGVLNPVTVRRKGDKYELIIGQRRFLACKRIGKSTIRAEIREDLNDADARALSLAENVMRADMHPLDKAEALNELYQEHGTYQKVSEKTGISPPTISKYTNLLELPEDLREELGTSDGSAGIISMSKLAREFNDPDDMRKVHSQIKGFKTGTQKEIISRSEGNINSIPGLVEKTQEGEFQVRVCHGLEECGFIPKELRQMVIKLVEKHD